MKAIGIYEGTATAAEQQFEQLEIKKPMPTDYDLLVKVTAISVNPVDTKVRQATPKQANLKILGYDAVGIVESVGTKVTEFNQGDRVFYAGSNQRSGSNQEFQLVDSRLVSLAPKKLNDTDAAAMPLTMLTAYELIFEKFQAKFAPNANQGKTILIINGAGGVGSAAIQLAKWAGFKVIATASRPETIAWVNKMGADLVVNHRQNLWEQLGDQYGNQIDDIMILHSTESYFNVAARLVSPLGHVGSIVETAKPVELGQLKDKAASFDWEFMFAKAKYGVQLESQGKILGELAKLLDSGQIITTRAQTINTITTTTLQQAHEQVEANRMVGKLVLSGPFM
ncbi:zinc-binding dehydrogenase [Paucilactobacillus hokkaidonensis JCM 18461]|uniref:Zinc-type alcohol dehydrogenase-like protein n=2 Tax=Paucilactobacillus hokkaidonensis TaxID=1193095 RepID=A0A0A1GX58_9LACO|nr:zinc-binding alcohol dehydrogenase family protein [Paucilactobacillus hokkaidonensis]KRO08764.1 zinc-binding dehydrogenase [Paucilactobacillus hokkaidonensis]BAP86625.1 zinc-binding dehydrogenase [Paucilactobacillus hokkaidonensis JCM 18461]